MTFFRYYPGTKIPYKRAAVFNGKGLRIVPMYFRDKYHQRMDKRFFKEYYSEIADEFEDHFKDYYHPEK